MSAFDVLCARSGASHDPARPPFDPTLVGRCPVCDHAKSLLILPDADGTAEVWCVMNHGLCTTEAIVAVCGIDPGAVTPGEIDSLFSLPHGLTIGDTTKPSSSWAPVNLDSVLDGSYVETKTSILTRADGVALLYAGKTHSFHGESESGKSFVALIAATEVLGTDEGRVLFVDFESDQGEIVKRLLALGVDKDAIRSRFVYVKPDADPRSHDASRDSFEELLGQSFELAVLDGVTEAMSVFGLSGRDEGEVASFFRALPNRIAQETGAAVVLVDHVTKSNEGRGRMAIGSQHKMSGLSGASYTVEPKVPIRKGHEGLLEIRVGKDRESWVRSHAGPWRASDRTQAAASVRIDSRAEGRTLFEVLAPIVTPEDAEDGRPILLMERISAFLGIYPGASKTAIREGVKGNASALGEALLYLIEDGYVEVEGEARGARHNLIEPFGGALIPSGRPGVLDHAEEGNPALPRVARTALVMP